MKYSIPKGSGQQYFFNQIREAISSDRIASYLLRLNQNELQAYGAYAWNVALCESLYIALHGIEITLRNGINDAAVAEFGDLEWYLADRNPKRAQTVKDATSTLQVKQKPLIPGNYIAEFTFGFWIGLYNRKNQHGPWQRVLVSPFKHAPKKRRSLSTLLPRLERIRRLRNRVFHHEPIWHWQKLPSLHSEIIETIGWINPEMRRFVEMLDRFPETYATGAEFYEQELLSVFQS